MPRPSRTFVPPFCPNPDCSSHAKSGRWRFKKKGFFVNATGGRRIQRYLCQHCYRSCSSQTFDSSYWLRRPDLLISIFHRSLACSGLRQIAREFGVAHSTIQRHLARLGRHCLLFHERLRPKTPSEPLVLDGFRTLEAGHYWPFDLNLLVGVSHYVYGFNDAELRRSGSMRPSQKKHRARLEQRHGRPDPQATRKAVQELVERIVPVGGSAEVRSDEHRSYPQALLRLEERSIVHRTTSSREARTADNPLFPVNLADLLLRHCGANHKRETIAFSKRRQGALDRVQVFACWRNYMKWTSENRKSAPPAVALGLIPRPLTVRDLFARRLFPWRQELTGWLESCYFGRIPTRCIPRNRIHQLAYAV